MMKIVAIDAKIVKTIGPLLKFIPKAIPEFSTYVNLKKFPNNSIEGEYKFIFDLAMNLDN